MSQNDGNDLMVVDQSSKKKGVIGRVAQGLTPLAMGFRALLGNMVGGAVEEFNIKDGVTVKTPLGSSGTAWTEVSIKANPDAAVAMASAEVARQQALVDVAQARAEAMDTVQQEQPFQ